MTKKAITVVILALMTLAVNGTAEVYPPENIPFEYDPAEYKLLGGVEVRAGQSVVVEINCHDPDGDPFTIEVLNPQSGMTWTNGDGWKLNWTPLSLHEGIHYINIEAKDAPPDPNDALTDRGTIVFKVNPRNRPPILRPCGG